MALLKKRSKRGQSRLDFGADSVHESQHGLLVQDGPRLLDLDMEGKIALKAHIAFRVTPNGQRHLDRNSPLPGQQALCGAPDACRYSRASGDAKAGALQARLVVDMAGGVAKCGGALQSGLRAARLFPLTQVFTSGGVDGKRDFALFPVVCDVALRVFRCSELPSDVVEAGAEVMAGVSDQKADLIRTGAASRKRTYP